MALNQDSIRTNWPRYVAGIALVVVIVVFAQLVAGFDRTTGTMPSMPFIAFGVWIAVGASAFLASNRRPARQRAYALLAAYVALWMLLGSPDFDDGGQWFAFVFFIYFLPVALIALMITMIHERAVSQAAAQAATED